ncbi:TPA: NUDIX hydrolase [Candidatus Collierbacteria bacterium]|uniref:NUDIX hydrolase n=1 Tax=Candidatus Collierbacteria bacterium GW2011_GWB2_44_22 TaxID=1618387 RepID=A0A0G1KWH4_9BACT|nr:MAG: NUDIX hydrolase [Candidatus Collierbacteria bacterium GW2011_GWA2_44_13]KKT50821.1 MAG: NUDIX hydrolase [Candidatus Collierbacteria bacterium GW2011_GWB1_44_197]KKT52264.1 MAG: NUDIX hydrolase [Candidatus Collierbacteria bacterium GW2011_GWB2_44_22]KKT63184.1 MAG: NUDIX hydrolase [Candidatus Collierbacteria bacterium GW2011_GWD1_44_27]KKT66094.1 MAG: NUDIX hydrolase [Candidatus Collierbacteria bacterium GW2011_GWC2_44_30]KKT89229.1 MAG: NUDIX hydrolase [Candidatus Collierbacteria bacte
MQSTLHETVKGPAVAVDTVVFGIDEKQLKVLLLKIKGGPYNGKWALPGGLVNLGESPEITATRVLKNKTNIRSGYLEQLYTFGNPDRDVRGQVVSVAHMLLVNNIKSYDLIVSEHYTDIRWLPVLDLPETAFDHSQIIDFALTRVRGKMAYSNIAGSFLPKDFSLDQLRDIYEVTMDKPYDHKKFENEILSHGLLTESGNGLYHFKADSLSYFD